jgi:predicted RNA-binding protein with PUA domain
MIEIPDREELDEVMSQGPIITSHRFAALRERREGPRSNDGSPELTRSLIVGRSSKTWKRGVSAITATS